MDRVLLIGLDPYRVPGDWDPEPVAAAIERATVELGRRGIDSARCLVGLDGSDDVPVVIASALAEVEWDCVLVGGGIRGDDLELFETVVNLVHEYAPGASIAFNRGLGDIAEAVVRRLARR